MSEYSDIDLIEEFIQDGDSTQEDIFSDGDTVNEEDGFADISNVNAHSEMVVSPSGKKTWKPYVSEDLKIAVGDQFPSVEDAELAYRKYADASGFDVRKSNRKHNKYGIVQNMYLLCNRQGIPEKKDFDSMAGIVGQKKGRNSNLKRTGCKACIKVRFRKQDRCHVVYKFEDRHNHDLYYHGEKRLSRGRRQLQYMDYRNIYNATGSSFGGSKTHTIQSAFRGGIENVSASAQDYKNASRDLISFVGIKDAQMLINLLTKRQQYDPNFFFEYRIVDGELHSVFWVDAISKLNYQEFGDTVSFDATYRTNRHAMNFVPFIAIDNHNRSVVVGSALISNEDLVNWSWLLTAFLKAHGKQPRFVITDQCLACKSAIPAILPESKHRLCAWHIMKKMPNKVIVSPEDNLAFKKRINRLVWSTHIDADFFEEEWQKTLSDYGLEGDPWLSEIYEIREQWISAYYKDDPMSSLMRTTSRSESSHAYFRLFASFKNDLVRFLRAYDGSIEKQRNKHACLEFATRNTFPRCFSPLDIERHASEVYTRMVFFDVQKEIRKSMYYCGLMFLGQDGDSKRYSVSHKKENMVIKTSYQVVHDVKLDTHTCECNMFVRRGLICRHVFKILMNDGVDKIPEKYIVRRWTRSLIPVHVQAARVRYAEVDVEKQDLINGMYADFDLIVSRIRNDKTSLREASATIAGMKVKYGASIFRNNPAKDKAEALKECYGVEAPEEPAVLPASGLKNKGNGRGKRLIGALEKAVKKAKKPMRLCATCKTEAHHDSRNCPLNMAR